VPHVELSLFPRQQDVSDEPAVPAQLPRARTPEQGLASPIERWAVVAAGAGEPCLVLDPDGVIVASSPAFRLLFGLGEAQRANGRGMLDGLYLVDFTARPDRLARGDLERIPPLLALSTGGLARGLLRVRVGELVRTVDAVATPLWDGPALAGSLSFFSPV